MIGSTFSLNGQLRPITEACLPVDHTELAYGFGVYESLRLRRGCVYFLGEHIERLLCSAQVVELEHLFTKEKIKKWTEALVAVNPATAANVKMLLIGSQTPAGALLYIFLLSPFFLEKKDYRGGVKVTTFRHERFLPEAKTLNMLPSYLAYREARRAGAFDALLVARDGTIREGTRTNFFAVKGRTLITPPVKLVLDGITRRTVIACARQHGYGIIEDSIRLKEISAYGGAFVTNTSGGIVPVKQIDNFVFPDVAVEISDLRKCYSAHLDALFAPTVSCP
ncbi:MAG: Aminotransferase class IV [Candidatus Magasanikbacteria bacterium GW2011_GWA2_56_11]|uniref:Aminotransferase class IV n=1 Tax=Candidatus Magasanikbacteria bacterium GW2011_GWA2_56_11 TaxID=1619044 RepID=A0A0G2BBB5_9BACT|nr:MAG: Aminotransferase class IV [Candidatus Magasanikbacteria bacterium GW2011_GWA2_56_11]